MSYPPVMEQMTVEDREGVRWIHLSGDLDQSEVLQIKAEFDRAVNAAPGDVVLGLRGVTFMGTLGIGLLVSTLDRVMKQGRKLALSEVPESLERTFEAMTLNEVFDRV